MKQEIPPAAVIGIIAVVAIVAVFLGYKIFFSHPTSSTEAANSAKVQSEKAEYEATMKAVEEKQQSRGYTGPTSAGYNGPITGR